MKHWIFAGIAALAFAFACPCASAQNTPATPVKKTVSQDSINKVVKLANAGSAREQNIVGIWYYTGENLPLDYKRAATWWSKAAKQSYPLAIGNLGLCYQMGNGVTADSVTAVRLYQKSIKEGNPSLIAQQTQYAESGNVFSAVFMGSCLQNGTGMTKDLTKAAKFYRIAAEKGSVQAQRDLAMLYLNSGKAGEAVKWFKAGAAGNDPTCTYYYGKLLQEGKGVEADPAQGFNLLLKAAQDGFPMAQYAVGMSYVEGTGTVRNDDLAFDWIHQAACNGVAKAQWATGEMYMAGGARQNFRLALVWYSKAADRGFSRTFVNKFKENEEGNWLNTPFGHYVLGMKALDARNFDKALSEFKAVAKAKVQTGKTMEGIILADKDYPKYNPKKAFKTLGDAAKHGDPVAMLALGEMYETGEGTAKDMKSATEYVAKSAETGYAPAICALADMYYEGRGVEQSYNTAVGLYLKAQEMGQLTPAAAKRLASCYENGWGGLTQSREAAQEVLDGNYADNTSELLRLVP